MVEISKQGRGLGPSQRAVYKGKTYTNSLGEEQEVATKGDLMIATENFYKVITAKFDSPFTESDENEEPAIQDMFCTGVKAGDEVVYRIETGRWNSERSWEKEKKSVHHANCMRTTMSLHAAGAMAWMEENQKEVRS